MTENLVYIPLPIAKMLADKDKKINILQEKIDALIDTSEDLDYQIKKLKEENELLREKPIKDYYDFYGVSESDF